MFQLVSSISFRKLFSKNLFSSLLVAAALCFSFASQGTIAASNAESNEGEYQYQVSRVNINTANEKELAAVLKGVGKEKAKAIVEWRNSHGKFKDKFQLTEVKGIGEATVIKNKERILL